MGFWHAYMGIDGGGTAAAVVVGCVQAMQVYQPGAVAAEVYQPGAQATQVGCQ